MLLLWTGSTVGANGIESLLFSRVGPEALPFLYIALGPATFAVMAVMTWLLGRAHPMRLLPRLPLVLAGILLVTRAILFLGLGWFLPVLWLLMMVLWTLQGIAGWGLAGAVSDTRQAKRLFPLYGAGLILGSAIGGLLTPLLARWLHAENLVLVWAASLAGASFVAGSISRMARPAVRRDRAPAGGTVRQIRDGFRQASRSPLLSWMSVALVLFALLYFALSFLFARVATARYPSEDDLAGFLGAFSGLNSVAALLLSVFLAGRLFARFGVARMVLGLALLYVAGFATLLVTAPFLLVTGFRFLQMVWVNGVWATGWQALFNVVPPERRDRTRVFMDGGPLQLGISAGGALLLVADRLLPPRSLAIAGVAAATLATVAMLRARGAYRGAVVEALREGNPEVFVAEEEPFGGFRQNAEALRVVLDGTTDPDPAVRRLSFDILSEIGVRGGSPALFAGLEDASPEVRQSALRTLAAGPDPAALPRIVPLLAEEDPSLRAGAVDALAACASHSSERALHLRPLLDDPDPGVRARAAVPLVRDGDEAARAALAAMAGAPDASWRARGVAGLGSARVEPETVAARIGDEDPGVRRAAVLALGGFGPRWVEPIVSVLGDAHLAVRDAAVDALARIGSEATPSLMAALSDPGQEDGALLALARVPGRDGEGLRAYASRQQTRALHYHDLWRALPDGGDERYGLLSHALRYRAVSHAMRALRAQSYIEERGGLQLAVENLASRDPNQVANALESLDAAGDPVVVRPLLPIWEPASDRATDPSGAVERSMEDEDPWVRACAALAAGAVGTSSRPWLERLARSDPDPLVVDVAGWALEGESPVETRQTLSLMDRILSLRKVPLFRELSPADLKHVAESATEFLFADGTVIAHQGEPGDAMHVVVSGEVRVLLGGEAPQTEVARRGPGYIVGEMAILSEEPRMASLVAAGDVRALSIDRTRFQRILRERPEAALAVMRELCFRLKEASVPLAAAP